MYREVILLFAMPKDFHRPSHHERQELVNEVFAEWIIAMAEAGEREPNSLALRAPRRSLMSLP